MAGRRTEGDLVAGAFVGFLFACLIGTIIAMTTDPTVTCYRADGITDAPVNLQVSEGESFRLPENTENIKHCTLNPE